MAYADYAYYTDVYGGGKIPENLYGRYSEKADSYIDRATFFRIQSMDEIPDCVKICSCELAELNFDFDSVREERYAENSVKQSEKIGSYSVSYRDMSVFCAEKSDALQDVLLNRIPADLMYTGVTGI